MPQLRHLFQLHGALLLLVVGTAWSAGVSRGSGAPVVEAPAAPPIEAPAGWQSLPDLAERASAAAAQHADQRDEVAAHVWGDPPSGAFALLATTSARGEGRSPREVMASLRTTAEAAGATFTEWSEADGTASLGFEWLSFRGLARVRAEVQDGDGSLRAALFACFYSERQPARSEASCQTFVKRFEEMP